MLLLPKMGRAKMEHSSREDAAQDGPEPRWSIKRAGAGGVNDKVISPPQGKIRTKKKIKDGRE